MDFAELHNSLNEAQQKILRELLFGVSGKYIDTSVLPTDPDSENIAHFRDAQKLDDIEQLQHAFKEMAGEDRAQRILSRMNVARIQRFQSIGHDNVLGQKLLDQAFDVIKPNNERDLLIKLARNCLLENFDYFIFTTTPTEELLDDELLPDDSAEVIREYERETEGNIRNAWNIFSSRQKDIKNAFPELWTEISDELDQTWQETNPERELPSKYNDERLETIIRECHARPRLRENVVDFPSLKRR